MRAFSLRVAELALNVARRAACLKATNGSDDLTRARQRELQSSALALALALVWGEERFHFLIDLFF